MTALRNSHFYKYPRPNVLLRATRTLFNLIPFIFTVRHLLAVRLLLRDLLTDVCSRRSIGDLVLRQNVGKSLVREPPIGRCRLDAATTDLAPLIGRELGANLETC